MATLYKPNGIVSGPYLGLQANTHLTTPRPQVLATFAGFDGDQRAGLTRKADSRTAFYPRCTLIRNERLVTIVPLVELVQAAAAMRIAEIRPEWIGANVLLDGIPV